MISGGGRGLATIGLDLGPMGRWLRIGSGLIALAAIAVELTGESSSRLILFAAYMLAVGAAYTAAHRILGDRLLARVSGWVGSLILLGPVGAVYALELGSGLFRMALGAYLSVSLLLASAIRYGGCEVVALPTWIFRRRFKIYCPWNAVDAVERPLTGRQRTGNAIVGAALLAAFAILTYLLVILPLLDLLHLPIPFYAGWALVLNIPASVLGIYALRRHGADEWSDPRTRAAALGAAVLALLSLVLGGYLDAGAAWSGVLLAALAWLGVRRLLKRGKSGSRAPGTPA